jgi:hypothetical protein
MTLGFYTNNHQMTFVNATTHHVTNAWNLLPNTTYEVFFVVKNDADEESLNVQIVVTHSPFGIGLPQNNQSGIIEPSPVNIPPAGPGGVGLATVMFQYHAPPGGHCCLCATIQPDGPTLQQNTDVRSTPIGTLTEHSFLVFGGDSQETMILTLKERLVNGVPVPQSWNPLLVAPPGTGSSTPQPSPITLTLEAGGYYSVGLQVNPPARSTPTTHIFHIEGSVNNEFVGEVNIRVESRDWCPPPDPFVHGGYHSSDIILYDPITGLAVPVSGMPDGDSLLRPDTPYGFAACVHNDSPTQAVNTVVRFWRFEGGVGSNGSLVDVQTATVPAYGSVVVHSAYPFWSAPANQHECAAISIYNAQAHTCTDAVTYKDVPDPNANHSCSAWRNTDSIWVFLGRPWEIYLEVNQKIHGPDPVEIEVHTQHVPDDWQNNEQVRQVQTILAQGAAASTNLPLYLMPMLYKTLKPIDLKIEIKTHMFEHHDLIHLDEPELFSMSSLGIARSNGYRLFHKEGKAPFKLTGIVPDTAKPGDILLVQVTAHYRKTHHTPTRSVQFTEVMFVKEK